MLLTEAQKGELEEHLVDLKLADLLGPVDLPPGVRRPPATPADEPAIRMLVRVPREEGLILAGALRAATAVHSARHDHEAVRVQIDPLHIG